MSTKLPLDSNDNPIPALRFKNDAAHVISSGVSSARNSTAFDADTRVVSLYATHNIYVRFGDDSVTATIDDHYFPAGQYYDVAIGGDGAGHYSHVAVLRVDTDGAVYVSEKE